ncbi:MAG TPA: hypothetical protein VNE82_24365 [Candidatus Binataceae bacterium]|nr:hypothetical protein [Candidatus Binataceae bacterium]
MNRIAILYPGGMGAALGHAVGRAGGMAITCLSGRSEATRYRACDADFVVVASLEQVIRQSEIVISLVPPASAVETARRFIACCELTGSYPPDPPTFVEANSLSPRTKQRIAELLSHAGIPCVDGAFFGPANQVGRDNVLALSGAKADRVASILQKVIEVRVIGGGVGQASSLKMALGVMTKALCALFLEMVCASADCGQLDSTVDLMRRLYPGTMRFLERSLPTYPCQVARKAYELKEVASWLHDRGQWGIMTESALAVLDRLQRAELEPRDDWAFEDLVRRIADSELLRTI